MDDIAERLQELALGWFKLNNTNYRLHKICALQWKSYITKSNTLELQEFLLTCGYNGGPIAIAKRYESFLSENDHLLKKHIGIFNGCGLLIAKPDVNVVLLL